MIKRMIYSAIYDMISLQIYRRITIVIHTIELSRMMSKATFDTIIKLLQIPYNRRCWFTTKYASQGFLIIRLYKFLRSEFKDKQVSENDLTHHYMISMTINTGTMFGSDGHLSNNILTFTPDVAKAIYNRVYDLIPCLEHRNSHYSRFLEPWFEFNALKARRIDFAFDLKTAHQQYLTLINRGYALRQKTFKRNYYTNNVPDIPSDEEPDIPDVEELLGTYDSDVNYIYYRGNGLNINIYHKETEIMNEGLFYNFTSDYDFLRIEVQAKKQNCAL